MPIEEIDAEEFSWFDILPEPFVVLILGMRGGGKTALGHLLLELFSQQGRRKPAYIIGFPMHKRHLLPAWMTPLDELYFPDNSVVLLHEAHFYLHARRSMADQNIEIDKLITVSRHKNVDIIVETQQSFRLDRNIVAEVDALIFRVPELMQEKFERPEVRWITEMAKKAFEPYIEEYIVKKDGVELGRYRRILDKAKKKAFIYGKNYVGMYPHDIPLPSYWNDEISKAYGELPDKSQEHATPTTIEDKIKHLCESDPRYIEYFSRMVEWEEQHKDGEFYDLGFEWSDVKVPPATLRRLYLDGIIRITYKSNRRRGYLLNNVEETKRALSALNQGKPL